MPRQRATSGAPWESKYGYCRAVRAGNTIYVAGTAPVDNSGNTFAPNDHFAQTKRCFEIGLSAISELGGRAEDVVRTRMYVTDISHTDDYGRAHSEIFADHPPACTMIEVSKLVSPDMTIEIEMEAVVDA
ncbi:MAG: RidA family protein [Planctomycetota bacterium]|jgi:isochorismate pyruvate lyase